MLQTLASIAHSIPSPDPKWQYFDLGQLLRDMGLSFVTADLKIHAYALFILTGIVIATMWTNRRLIARGAEDGQALDIIICAVPIGIIGGRFYHVITHPSDYFYEGAPWTEVFAVWNGGLAIFGSLMFGALGAWIGCKRTGVQFWAFADALVPGLMIAQAIGRLGNWFNHELFGQPTTLPWGLEIPETNYAFPEGLPADTLFHPTFLYEILWNVVGLVLLLWISKQWQLKQGQLFGMYMIWYGIGRSWLESIRIDPSEIILGLRVNVWTAIIVAVAGAILVGIHARRPTPEHPALTSARAAQLAEKTEASSTATTDAETSEQ